MPTSVYFNNQNASREQLLLEDMIIESIKNHGIDIFYLPRTSLGEIDSLFGDDPVKYYNKAYKIDMYLETFNDFGGQQEFFSKFGLQIEKTARMAIARRTFEKYVPQNLRNIPKEGDLIYLPAQRKLMEIRFVDRDISFFQLGKQEPYMYVLSLETFKYNGEFLNTGYEDIDFCCDDSALSTNFYVSNVAVTGSETYRRGEVAYQGANVSSATSAGIVVEFDYPNAILRLRNIKGAFVINTTIVGANTNTTSTLDSYNILDPVTEGEITDNVLIENEADAILDFSETNPFGEP